MNSNSLFMNLEDIDNLMCKSESKFNKESETEARIASIMLEIRNEDMIDFDGLGKESIPGQIMSQIIAQGKQILRDMADIYILSLVLRYRIFCRYASRSPLYDRYREYLRKQYDKAVM